MLCFDTFCRIPIPPYYTPLRRCRINTLTFWYSGSGSSEISNYDNYVSGSAGQRPPSWTFVETVVINEGVTTIGTNVFDQCTSLKYIYIPKSVTLCKNRAFNGCSVMEKVFYAGTPNDWANIDFEVLTSYCYSHPFCARYSGTRSFYFYGQTTKETKNIIFTAPLTTIKQYAFYKANNIENIHIPGTVTTIETHALDCSVKRVYINKSVAPTTGDNAITWISGTDTYLYLRSDASNSYNTTPWYYPSSKSTTGAYWLGYSDDHSSIKEECSWKSTRYVVVTSGTQGNINWSLSEDGTLTLSGNGTLPKDYNTTNNSSDVLPWFRYRYLVNKVVIKPSDGNITNLTNALDKSAWEIEEINIEQATIPTATFNFVVGTTGTNAEDYRYSTDKVNLLVKANATTIANAKTKWTDSHIQLGLNESVVLDEATDNTSILTAIKNNIIPPFTANLNRSLKSVSFNSFCSPVPMTAEQVQSVFGAGTEIYTLANSSYNESENTLYINLSDNQTSIEAGKPYIIKPASNEPTITIDNVNPEDIATAGQTILTDAIDFHGLLNPYILSGEKFLVVSANDELNWTTSGTMKGMRSYFTLKSGIPARALSARASFVFPNNSPEAVNNVSNAQQTIQKVMRNGQLVIIRDGVTYNTMGQVIE